MQNIFKTIKKTEVCVQAEPNSIYAPVGGKTIPLSHVNDSMFARGLLGRGIAIRASSDVLYAPVAGIITAVPESGHAVALQSEEGLEVLLHIGINTVELKGECFSPCVKKGDYVKIGQKLVEFDRKSIKRRGYDDVIMVVLTNSDEYEEVTVTADEKITKLQKIIGVK